jgi:hypothetical protein
MVAHPIPFGRECENKPGALIRDRRFTGFDADPDGDMEDRKNFTELV